MAKQKPDIWMPLYIGDYLAATTHLSAEESGGYLHLLMHQWKNGSLPSDSEALRRIARIDKDAWSNAWSTLQAFFEHSSGIPVQMKLEEIRQAWEGKKATAVAKAQAAAAKRWGSDAPSITTSNAQAMPQPCPSSSPSSLKKIPSRDKREPDPRHNPFKEILGKAWKVKNPTTEMPWGPAEAKQLSMLLASVPSLEADAFRQLLHNRHRSETNQSDRPSKWLHSLSSYGSGPVDRFGKPVDGKEPIPFKPVTLAEKFERQMAQ